MNILIIDDDEDDTEIFCAALREINPDAVFTVRHFCKQIDLLIHDLPVQRLIFVDGHMHPVNGTQCVTELQKVIDSEQTKIIIHTGSLSPAETVEFRKLGVTEIIRKAHGFEELKTNLKRVITQFT